jgi:phage baseplate assembly protein gpV
VSNLLETLRQIVQQEMRSQRVCELATVKEQFPHAEEGDKDNHAVTVVLRDSGIELKKVPVATSRKGVASIPDVGDLVLVQFVGGDINAPIVVGSLYNDEDRPPPNASGQYMLRLPAAEDESGSVQLLIDSEQQRSLTLTVGGGVKVTLIDDDPPVKIDVADGSAVIEIARDGTVKFKSNNNIEIKAAADIKIEASGQLTLKGATVNIN